MESRIDEDDSGLKIKDCFVCLEKLNIDEYDSDSSSSFELPKLPYLLKSSSSKPKSRKSTQELLMEHQNLASNIKIDIISNNDMEEKMRTLEIVPCNDVEEDDSLSSSPPLYEERKCKFYCVNDSLQFFNSRDVTPFSCGYDKRIEVNLFEKEMLSFKRVELENVISSFLFSSNAYCISDCKSFVTYLLRSMSVCEDVASVSACYNVLNLLLTEHNEARSLKFSSAEIFMLLFNYGIDIDSFPFLQQWPDVKKCLEVPQNKSKSYCKIPSKWPCNLKMIMKSVAKLIATCQFKEKSLCQIIIFFLWMSLDTVLFHENLYATVHESISACLDCIIKDNLKDAFCNIVSTLISMDYSNAKEKWYDICQMTESVPVISQRGILLRRHISFLSLKCICLRNIDSEMDENWPGFSLNELQHLMQKLVEMDYSLLAYAAKFLDICITHLNATKEEYQELCDILKQCESSLSNAAYEVKAHFLKIHSKLKILIGKNSFYKITSQNHNVKNSHMFKRIKREFDELSVDSEVNTSVINEVETIIKNIKSEPVNEEDCEMSYIEQDFYSTAALPEKYQASTIHKSVETNLEYVRSNDASPFNETAICEESEVHLNNIIMKDDCNYSGSNSESEEKSSDSYFNDSPMEEQIMGNSSEDFTSDAASADKNIHDTTHDINSSDMHDFSVKNKSLLVTESFNDQNKKYCESITQSADPVQDFAMQNYFNKEPRIKQEILDVCDQVFEMRQAVCDKESEIRLEICDEEPEMSQEICDEEPEMSQEICDEEPEMSQEICNEEPEISQQICNKKLEIKQEICDKESEIRQKVCDKELEIRQEISDKEFEIKQEICDEESEIEQEICDKEPEIIFRKKDVPQNINNLECEINILQGPLLNKDQSTLAQGMLTESCNKSAYTEICIDDVSATELPVNRERMLSKSDNQNNFDQVEIDPVIARTTEYLVTSAVTLFKSFHNYQPNTEPSLNEHSNPLQNIKFDQVEVIDPIVARTTEDLLTSAVNLLKPLQNSQQNSKLLPALNEYSNPLQNISADFHLKLSDKIIQNKENHETNGDTIMQVSETNIKRKISELAGSSKRKKWTSSKLNTDARHEIYRKKPLNSPVKLSPKKSPKKINSPIKLSPKKSPKKFFDYLQRKQKYTAFKKKKASLLTKTGRHLTDILREKVMPSNTETKHFIPVLSDDSDSDVVELYTDPKRYADKECLVIFESEDVVVLSD